MADPTHPIVAAPSCVERAGHFGCVVTNDRILIPTRLASLLASRNLTTVEEFVAYLQAFPSDLASALHWSDAELDGARDELAEQLRGIVPPDILDPPNHPDPPFGALLPEGKAKTH